MASREHPSGGDDLHRDYGPSCGDGLTGHLPHAHECECLRVASSMMLDQRIGFFDFEGRKVAYSLVGEGPVLVFPPWWISHIELEWQQPGFRSFFSELVETHTVLRYDRLGVGLSDRRREPHHTSLDSELAVLHALLDERH